MATSDPLDLPVFSPTIPMTFDGGLKYYEQLMALRACLSKIKEAIDSGDIPGVQAKIDELWEYVRSEAFEGPISEWVENNLPCIVAQICKWFYFGFDDGGHVVCVIPTSWSNMSVAWNMDFGSEDFGKPTIEWK